MRREANATNPQPFNLSAVWWVQDRAHRHRVQHARIICTYVHVPRQSWWVGAGVSWLTLVGWLAATQAAVSLHVFLMPDAGPLYQPAGDR